MKVPWEINRAIESRSFLCNKYGLNVNNRAEYLSEEYLLKHGRTNSAQSIFKYLVHRHRQIIMTLIFQLEN